MRGHAVTRGPILPPSSHPPFSRRICIGHAKEKKRAQANLFFFSIEIRIRVSIIPFQFRDPCHEPRLSRYHHEIYARSIFDGKAEGNFCDEEIEETFLRSPPPAWKMEKK